MTNDSATVDEGREVQIWDDATECAALVAEHQDRPEIAALIRRALSYDKSGANPFAPLSQPSDVGDIVGLKRCTCMEVVGEDQRCAVHGFTLARAAAWTDEDCDLLDAMNTELDARVIREKAQQALATIRQLSADNAALRTERDEAQSAVLAWTGVVDGLEAHIMDRAAMDDPAKPETYLSILRGDVAEIKRVTRQICAARWSSEQTSRRYADALQAKVDEALNAIIDGAARRDVKWAGMTAKDIALFALSNLKAGGE